MYRMDYNISIGETVLPLLTSVKITKDVTKLTDTATIICPAVSHGRPLAFAKNLKKWQHVTIDLGYDGKLRREFDGYVEKITKNDGQITVECADAIILFKRVDMPNGEMKSPRLKDVLSRVIDEVNGSGILGSRLSLNCQYDYGFDKFSFFNATAYDVIDKIQKEGMPNIYILNDVLHIVPTYTSSLGSAVYSMQKNIRKDGLSLKWREEDDSPLRVEVKASGKDGKTVTASFGKDGGNSVKINFTSSMSQEDAGKIAENIYNQKAYTGYEGSFGAWLIPFCDAGYTVDLRDDSKALKPGRYWVTSVVVEMSNQGGSRQVGIGRAISV